MAQDQWTLQEKGKVKGEPAHGPPLQARVVAANRTVLAASCDDPGAHGNEQWGAKQNRTERGKIDEASRYGWQRWAGKHSLLNRAAAGKHSRRTI